MQITHAFTAALAIAGLTAPAMAASIDVETFADNFNSAADGTHTIQARTPDNGMTNGWTVGGELTGSATTDTLAVSGKSLIQTRGSYTVANVYSNYNTSAGIIAADRTYTFKLDFYVPTADDSTVIAIGDGTAAFDIYLAGNTWRYLDPATHASYINTGVANGTGAWNQIELEIINGPADENNAYTSQLNLYLARPETSSAGVLSRTQIATWSHAADLDIGNIYRFAFGIQSGTVYYDNVVFGYENAIPEPAAAGFLASIAALHLVRRRRA